MLFLLSSVLRLFPAFVSRILDVSEVICLKELVFPHVCRLYPCISIHSTLLLALLQNILLPLMANRFFSAERAKVQTAFTWGDPSKPIEITPNENPPVNHLLHLRNHWAPKKQKKKPAGKFFGSKNLSSWLLRRSLV